MGTFGQALSDTEGADDATLRSAASLTSQFKALQKAAKGRATG